MKNTYTIQQARSEDLIQVAQLLQACNLAMRSAGVEQWDADYPNLEQVEKDWQAQSLWILVDQGELLATITVDDKQADQYRNIDWQWNYERVLVIHRLAVHPSAQGRGIGRILGEWAEAYGREEGYQVIRLDAYSGNPHSYRLYERLAYHRAAGECWFNNKKLPFWCWEKLIV